MFELSAFQIGLIVLASPGIIAFLIIMAVVELLTKEKQSD
jgi:hypothetical protein